MIGGGIAVLFGALAAAVAVICFLAALALLLADPMAFFWGGSVLFFLFVWAKHRTNRMLDQLDEEGRQVALEQHKLRHKPTNPPEHRYEATALDDPFEEEELK